MILWYVHVFVLAGPDASLALAKAFPKPASVAESSETEQNFLYVCRFKIPASANAGCSIFLLGRAQADE